MSTARWDTSGGPRGPSRRSAYGVLALIAGCSTEVVELALPDPEGTHAVLVGLLYRDELSVFAVDRDATPDRWTLPGVPRLTGDARLFAMLYTSSLADLGLAPGKVQLDPAGVDPPVPEIGVYEAAVTAGVAGRWRDLPALPPELQFKLPVSTTQGHCRSLAVSARVLPTPGRVMAAVAEPAGGIFALNVLGEGFRITRSEVTELGAVGPLGAFGAARTATGAVYLGGLLGQLWVGTPEGGFEALTPRPHHETIRYLATSAPGVAPPEVYALARTGALERRRGGAWADIPLTPGDAADRWGALLWRGPGRVAAVAPLSNVLSLVDEDRVREVHVDLSVYGDLSSLAELKGQLYGVGGQGAILRFEDDAFGMDGKLAGARFNLEMRALGEGLLVASRGTQLRHYIPGNPPCPMVRPVDEDKVAWASVVAGDTAYVFFADSDIIEDPASLVVTVELE